MPSTRLEPGFSDYLLGIVDVSERDLHKLVEELEHHWSERQDEFVLRRHKELQRQGIPTRRIYGIVVQELTTRPFAARVMNERQVRRLIYG